MNKWGHSTVTKKNVCTSWNSECVLRTNGQGVDGVSIAIEVTVVVHLASIARSKDVDVPIAIATFRSPHFQGSLQEDKNGTCH